MRVLIAPTAYKGTLSPLQACEAIAHGVRQRYPHASPDLCPISDGGNGWLEVWAHHYGDHAQRGRAPVRDPLGRWIEAEYLVVGELAILESAQACGLHLLSTEELRPLDASTEGVGDLLLAVDRAEIGTVWLGLGGTATTDGGTGALRALGFRLLRVDGSPIDSGGRGLLDLARIEPPDPMPLAGKRLVLCADVRNPLCGEQGTARVFAPQKGATPEQVELLERGLAHLAMLIRQQTGVDVATMPGAGAAGGLPVGFVAFFNAPIVSGIEWLLEHIGWHERLQHADLLITGEGQVDAQTLMGKGVGELVKRAVALGKPVRIVAGRRGEGWQLLEQMPDVKVIAAQEIAPHLPPADALATAVQQAT
jgi:glycerate kinase